MIKFYIFYTLMFPIFSSTFRAGALASIAAFFFACLALFVKMLPSDMCILLIIFARGTVGTLFCFYLSFQLPKAWSSFLIALRDPFIWIRSFFLFAQIILSYMCYMLLSMTQAVSVLMTSPLFTLTWCWIKGYKPFSFKALFFMILGYTGILFISQPWSQPSQTLGWILGMLSSLFSSIADLMSSSVVKRHGFWVPLTYSYLMPMILGGVLYILLLLKMSYFTGSLESIDPDALRSMIPISYQWVILSFVGLSSVFAHFFQIQSMACSSYFAAPFLYTRVIFSVILNILVYGIWPSATTYLGVFMIIIMAIAFYFLSKNKFVLEK